MSLSVLFQARAAKDARCSQHRTEVLQINKLNKGDNAIQDSTKEERSEVERGERREERGERREEQDREQQSSGGAVVQRVVDLRVVVAFHQIQLQYRTIFFR